VRQLGQHHRRLDLDILVFEKTAMAGDKQRQLAHGFCRQGEFYEIGGVE
jgi:hypothetical protein